MHGDDAQRASCVTSVLSLIRGSGVRPDGPDIAMSSYLEVVGHVNDRLASCVSLTRRGFLGDAIREASEGNPVLEEAAGLMGPTVMEWLGSCNANSVPTVDRQLVGELNDAFCQHSAIDRLLVQNRRLALRRAPIKMRLDAVRGLARVDGENPAWEACVTDLERARLKELKIEVEAAMESEDPEEIKLLWGELRLTWTVPLPDMLVRTVKATYEAQRESRRAEAERASQATRVADLKWRFSEGVRTSEPLSELTLIWNRLGAEGHQLPAEDQAVYQRLVASAERKRRTMRLLKWAAAVVATSAIVWGVVIGVGLWQRHQTRTGRQADLESAVEGEHWSKAQAICAAIRASDGEWWTSEIIQGLALRTSAGLAARDQRIREFEKLIGQVREFEPLHEVTSNAMHRLMILATTDEQKERLDQLKSNVAQARRAWRENVKSQWSSMLEDVRRRATDLAGKSALSVESLSERAADLLAEIQRSWALVTEAGMESGLEDQHRAINRFVASQTETALLNRRQADALRRDIDTIVESVVDPVRYAGKLREFIRTHSDHWAVPGFKMALESAGVWREFGDWARHPASREIMNPTSVERASQARRSLEGFMPGVTFRGPVRMRLQFLERACQGLESTQNGTRAPDFASKIRDALGRFTGLRKFQHPNGDVYYATGARMTASGARKDAFDVFVARSLGELPDSANGEAIGRLSVLLDPGFAPELAASEFVRPHKEISDFLVRNRDWRSVARRLARLVLEKTELNPMHRGALVLNLLEHAESSAWPVLSSAERALIRRLNSLHVSWGWLDPKAKGTGATQREWARALAGADGVIGSDPVEPIVGGNTLVPRRFVGCIMPDEARATNGVRLLPRRGRAAGVYEVVTWSARDAGARIRVLGRDTVEGSPLWSRSSLRGLPAGTPVMWRSERR